MAEVVVGAGMDGGDLLECLHSPGPADPFLYFSLASAGAAHRKVLSVYLLLLTQRCICSDSAAWHLPDSPLLSKIRNWRGREQALCMKFRLADVSVDLGQSDPLDAVRYNRKVGR